MSWSSTRDRCSRPAAPAPTRRDWSSRRTARGRCAGSPRTPLRCTRASSWTGSRAGTGSAGLEVATTPERMQELHRRRGLATLLRHRGHGAAHAGRRRPSGSRCWIPRRSWAPTSCRRDGIAKAVRLAAAMARARGSEGRRLRGRRHRHRLRHPRGPRARRAARTGATSSANACCSAPASGGRASARWPACRSRSSPCSTSSCGPTRSRSSPARRARSCTRSCATRTWRCTSASAATTTASAATTTSRSRRRSRDSARPAATDAAVPHAVHARGLRVGARPRRPGCCRRSPGRMRRPTRLARSTACSVHARRAARSSGESAKVRGFWVCEAVWVTHGGGMGQQVAEWMATGEPSYDLAEADANRFYPFQTTPPYVLARGKQQYREVYDILHPLQQMTAPRDLRLTPFYARHAGRSARSSSPARDGNGRSGSSANEPLLPDDAPVEPPRRWAAQNWSPAVGAEHLATRERVALVRHHAVREVRRRRGRTRLPFLERSARTGSTGRSARSSTRRAHAARRHPAGPHDHAQGARSCSASSPAAAAGSTTWPGCARRSATASASRSPSAPGRCSRSACGGRARATCCGRHGRRRLERRRSRT